MEDKKQKSDFSDQGSSEVQLNPPPVPSWRTEADDQITEIARKAVERSRQNQMSLKDARSQRIERHKLEIQEFDDLIYKEVALENRMQAHMNFGTGTKKASRIKRTEGKPSQKPKERGFYIRFLKLLEKYHEVHQTAYRTQELQQFATQQMGTDAIEIRKEVLRAVKEGKLVSAKFSSTKTKFYLPRTWVLWDGETVIGIKPEHDQPLFSFTDGKRNHVIFNGLERKEVKIRKVA